MLRGHYARSLDVVPRRAAQPPRAVSALGVVQPRAVRARHEEQRIVLVAPVHERRAEIDLRRGKRRGGCFCGLRGFRSTEGRGIIHRIRVINRIFDSDDVAFGQSLGAHSAADAVARLQDDHVDARVAQHARGAQTGGARAHDHHAGNAACGPRGPGAESRNRHSGFGERRDGRRRRRLLFFFRRGFFEFSSLLLLRRRDVVGRVRRSFRFRRVHREGSNPRGFRLGLGAVRGLLGPIRTRSARAPISARVVPPRARRRLRLFRLSEFRLFRHLGRRGGRRPQHRALRLGQLRVRRAATSQVTTHRELGIKLRSALASLEQARGVRVLEMEPRASVVEPAETQVGDSRAVGARHRADPHVGVVTHERGVERADDCTRHRDARATRRPRPRARE